MKIEELKFLSHFFLVYFVQNGFLSYFNFLNSTYLATEGMDSWSGLVYFLSLSPYMLKIFVGMLSDRIGYRKWFGAVGLILQSCGVLGALLFNPGDYLVGFILCLMLCFVGLSMYDTTTDAIGIKISEKREEQASVQNAMNIGNSLGNIAVIGVLGLIYQVSKEWSTIFISLSLLSLLPLLTLWFITDPPHTPTNPLSLSSLRLLFTRSTLFFALYSLLFGISTFGFAPLIFPYLMTVEKISVTFVFMVATLQAFGMLLGGLAAKSAFKKITYFQSSILSPLLMCLGIGLLFFVFDLILVWPLYFGLGICWGFRTTVFLTLGMYFVNNKDLAATHYSLYMAIANVGIGVGGLVNKQIQMAAGYPIAFLFVIVMNGLAALVGFFSFRGEKDNEIYSLMNFPNLEDSEMVELEPDEEDEQSTIKE